METNETPGSATDNVHSIKLRTHLYIRYVAIFTYSYVQ